MRVLALGPVEVTVYGTELPLGGPKLTALFTALLFAQRKVVAVPRLVTSLWEEPPRSATALLHTYVSSLRRKLVPLGAGQVLETRAPGYRLNIEAADNDVETFRDLLVLARTEEREHRFDIACGHYQDALALWRGAPLGGVDAPFARAQALALEESRFAAEEGLARACLALRRPQDAIARLVDLTVSAPAREEARALLMRALFSSGRRGGALAV